MKIYGQSVTHDLNEWPRNNHPLGTLPSYLSNTSTLHNEFTTQEKRTFVFDFLFNLIKDSP